ncbi:hypothetical protein [Flavobacterium sp.]|uniref:hypothetical protein n=1 Tax=Flavobacterium sp. TaxID=239 RepID=UPI00286D8F00|nr:hypothetical protein [Flavobacterium sp.]
MKTKILALAAIALFAIVSISCSTSDSEPVSEVVPPVTVGNTGDLRLFVIDTAKVNTITMTGTNETTILNRKVNSNSYIGSFSLNNDASKFVYVDNQGGMVNGLYVQSKSVRVANANGSGDMAIYTAPANTNTVSNDIGFVKYGSSKIYFTTTTQTTVGGAIGTIVKLNSTNFDGTGLLSENYNAAPLSVYKADLTSDGKYLVTMRVAPNIPRIEIMDRTGDNGGGTVIGQEDLTADKERGSAPIFSYNNKFVYYAYAESQSLKVRIFDMTTKTWESKTIATNFTPTSFFMTISVASDNNRGVVVVDSYSNTPTKSYVFNLAGSSFTTFNNNDKTIAYIKAF